MLDWFKFTQIADKFQYKAKYEDREDLRQDIILRLAEIANNNGHEPFNEGAMIRVASYTVLAYWRDLFRRPTIIKFSSEIEDENGNSIELWQTLKDNNAIDLEAWVDSKTWLLGCPRRLIQIAYKKYMGNPLNWNEYKYLERYRQKEKKYLQISLN